MYPCEFFVWDPIPRDSESESQTVTASKPFYGCEYPIGIRATF